MDRAIIQAAGGILWRKRGESWEVALVHRPRYDDWSLPKGKLLEGERWQEGALREVKEETGCQGDLGEFAGVTSYPVGNKVKIVLFWNMRARGSSAFTPTAEIDEIAWLPPGRAIEKLDHEGERRLMEEVRSPD